MPKKAPETEPEVPSVDVVIQFNETTFRVPRDLDDWPTTAYIARIKAATTGLISDWLEFMQLLLGERQWNRLTTVTAGSTREFKKFLDTFTTTVKDECGL